MLSRWVVSSFLLLCWSNWWKQLKTAFWRGYRPRGKEGMAVGAWGSWPPCTCSQEAEQGTCCSASFLPLLLFILFGIPAPRKVLPAFRVSLLLLSGLQKTLSQVCRGLCVLGTLNLVKLTANMNINSTLGFRS